MSDRFHETFFDINAYGAFRDGSQICTQAIQAAIEACAKAGGGMVVIPAGRYVSGAIFLKSHVTLSLEPGAVLVGSSNFEDFYFLERDADGIERKHCSGFINGFGLKDVAIVGRGTIDGNGEPWWQKQREMKPAAFDRPRLIRFVDCYNVLIEGLTLINSPCWTVVPERCENVTIDKITIHNPLSAPNTDGINPVSCRFVRISNCQIDAGDDCVTLKSGRETDPQPLLPCENIAITNCIMEGGAAGVVIGSEMSGGVRNVVVSNCIFTGIARGIRVKSRRGRGSCVENLRVSNIIMDTVRVPFSINMYYYHGHKGNDGQLNDKSGWQVDETTPVFRDFYFSHITARNVKLAAGFIYGLPEMPVANMRFEDISISMAEEGIAGAPDHLQNFILPAKSGFYCFNVDGLQFRDLRISGQNGSALVCESIRDLKIDGFSCPTPPETEPVMVLKEVDGARVDGRETPMDC